jgi:prolyl oligopeptidase
VWHRAVWLEPHDDRALILLSRGGADAAVVREFDPQKKAFVTDGFSLPEAKSDLAWKDRDTLLVGTDFGPGSLTDSGYPRLTKEWKRGTALAAAALVYEGEKADVGVFPTTDRTPGFERDLVTRGITFWESDVFLRRNGTLIGIEKPRDADLRLHREWLLLTLRTRWQSTPQVLCWRATSRRFWPGSDGATCSSHPLSEPPSPRSRPHGTRSF